MGGRYIITRVQIGIIKAFIYNTEVLKLLEGIEESQFIGDSSSSIKIDIPKFQEIKLKK